MSVVAELMAISARTAPKTSGEDYLDIKVLEGDDVVKLGEAMADYGKKRKSILPQNKKVNTRYSAEYLERAFARDGENAKASEAVLLLGLRKSPSANLNCGGCGVERCIDRRDKKGAEFNGAQCGFRLLDLGIALGSAVKTASILNCDNRIMYTVGVVAKSIGLMDADWVIGIPLSATGNNIFTDRPTSDL